MEAIFLYWLRFQILIRLHYIAVGLFAISSLLLVGILDYGYKLNGWDLLHWRQQIVQIEISPMSLMLFIGGVKLAAILMLTLWNYLRYKAHNPPQEPQLSVQFVKERYCRYIVMRVMAVIDDLMVLTDSCQYHLQHSMLLKGIELFRWDARKLFELTELQLCLPIHQVYPVDAQRERELIHGGYDDGLSDLTELNIFNMLYDGDP
ncbi:uncharacterized protein Dwil_GK20348 [Drosophila willistoni]|uniref:GK20348 n=1 Tax=Drosophila willistoni TaxID=7260 RepID=B4N5C2_DROWI|nr:uncharacterized protein LOC6645850 [Drosophila willistoni]EDW79561.1 uncharacterized protein Dwil_GK20348 [Drosophila willistoni]